MSRRSSGVTLSTITLRHGRPAGSTLSYTPTTPGNAGTIVRVDAGATGPYTDGGGNVWAKDDGFVGGGLNTGTFAVSGTAEDALFATRRTGAFTYSRPVPNGEYTLRLLFTDYYAPGARVFMRTIRNLLG